MTFRTIHLTPPRISPTHIEEKISCIRAHRERIFRVETELQGNKLICHNYGQGGAGWTFLFGCVHESIRQLESLSPAFGAKSIAVIGAGCYGLLTACLLAHKGYNVRIIAKDIENVSSKNAAGFFFPRPRKTSTPQECAVFHALGMESYRTYQQIMQGNHPFIKRGAYQLPAYFGPALDPGFGPYIQASLMPQPEEVLIDFGNGKRYHTVQYRTVFMHAAELLQELQRTVTELGIPITHADIKNFDEISEPIIFNCAGLGAQQLTGDLRIIPVQGHLMTLKDQPPLDQLQYMLNVKVTARTPQGTPRDEFIYYAPKDDGIVGITFIRGQDSITANQHEFDRIIERCHDFFGPTK